MKDQTIEDSKDFVSFFMKLAQDVVKGDVPPDRATAAVKAGQVVTKMIELNMQWGNRESDAPAQPLSISGGPALAPTEPASTSDVDEDNGEEEVPINRYKHYPGRPVEEVINRANRE